MPNYGSKPKKRKLIIMIISLQEAYDDKMLSNIELKSTEFDDENFSPVFTRATQEFFLQPSERFR